MCILCEYKENKSLDGITIIRCSDCPNLVEIPKLPETIVVLECAGCTNLQKITELNNNLTLLDCSGCSNLKILPTLPSSLLLLNCSFTAIKEIPELPNSLETLRCCACPNLTELPVLENLPNLQRVYCWSCPILKKIPTLPPILTNLDCGDCRCLLTMPHYNIGIGYLYYGGCPWMDTLISTNSIQKLVFLQKNLKKLTFKRRLIQRHHLKKFLYTDLVNLVLQY